MKILILVAYLLCCSKIFAQKNFEGRIIYNMYPAEDSLNKKKMIVYLKENKIFIEYPVKDFSKPNSLYDFNEGRAYMFVGDSIVTYLKLARNIFPFAGSERNSTNMFLKIAGRPCYKRSSIINAPMNNYFDKIENWFTNEIFFKVNDSFNFIVPPVLFFSGVSISLKTNIILNRNNAPRSNDIIVEAVEIVEENIPASKFEIGKYKRIISLEAYSKELLEKFKAIDGELKNKNR